MEAVKKNKPKYKMRKAKKRERQGYDMSDILYGSEESDNPRIRTIEQLLEAFASQNIAADEYGRPFFKEGVKHWASVDPKTGRFLKSSDHPSVQKEIDWYHSDDPQAVIWRKIYDLKTEGLFGKEKKFYKYAPKKGYKKGF
jgi:hypothetical protein